MTRQLVLVTHYYPGHLGGIEKVAAELARQLANNHGWKVTWAATRNGALPERFPSTVQFLPASAWNGLDKHLGVPWPVWSPAALLALWREIGRADVVHLHDVLYFGNAFAWLFARLRGVPVIVTQHVGSVPYRSALIRRVHALANRTLGRMVLSTAHQAVFISPAVMEEFSRFCRFRSPAIYWPNGVDMEIFAPAGKVADAPEIKLRRQTGKHVLLFAGRFVEKKGLSILRELAKSFPEDLWVFAGHGPIDPILWGLPNVMVVHGVTGAELACYYRAADMLVLPSVGEGFPLVVQEAMACGTPAMIGEETAAGCPAARSLIYVEKVGSEDAVMLWKQHLARILSEPEELQARRHEVSKFARDNWSWDAVSAQYASLISGLARGPKAQVNIQDS